MSDAKRRRPARPTLVEYTPGQLVAQSRAANDSRLALAALQRATNLAVIVRDEGADSIAAILDPLDTRELYATIAVLAALVPDDVPHQELLGWLTGEPGAAALAGQPARDVVLAGHAAFARGVRNPETCALETTYQRQRKAEQRARRREADRPAEEAS